jgi:ABC-type antimicrobial peptide transport system permease subunit/AraC-like DNA-binding protein
MRTLSNLLSALSIILFLWITFTWADWYYHLGNLIYYPLYLILSVLIIWMAAWALSRQETSVGTAVRPQIFSPIPPELKQKGTWLKNAMKANSYHRDMELSLGSLSGKLGLTPHELSRIINTVHKKSFNDFVNGYRVADVARRMQDPANNHLTLMGMAYESGFNSKTSFNRIFKQMTGKNPVDYKLELKKEAPSYKLGLYKGQPTIISYQQTAPSWADTKANRNFMFKNYLKTAWRRIGRNKINATINILGLSLGICACLLIYLITSFELSFDKFHPGKERIYRIVVAMQDGQGQRNDMASMISSLPLAMRNELSGFDGVTAFYNYFPKVTIPGSSNSTRKFGSPKQGEEKSPVIVAEPQYFNIFKYQWLQGNPATALQEPFKVVLSRSEAYRYFGTAPLAAIIGKQVIYNDSLRLTVSGIVEDWTKNSDFSFKDFISFATVEHSFLKNDIDLHNWGMWDFNSQGYVKLAHGVTPAQIEKQFPGFVKAHIKVEGTPPRLSLQPLADIHFDNRYHDAYSRQAHLPTLYALIAIAVFILLIAVINFINLSTAQSLARAREVGVHKVLGGSKTSLTMQFMVETFILTLIAVVIALFAIHPVIFLFHSFIPPGANLSLLSLAVFLFLVLILIVTSILAGFYPARLLSSYLPALSLKGQGATQFNHKSYLRKTLIVFQFTVSLVFIIGTIIVGNQISFILNKDLGFNKDAIITMHTEWNNSIDQLNVFCNKVKEIPGVQIVSRHRTTPAAERHGGTIIFNKGAEDSKTDASFDFCDENYVPLFGLKIIAGRDLIHSDTIKEYLINETCAKALGFKKPEDAVGKFVGIGMPNSTRQIAGVVKDFNSKSLHETVTPFFMASVTKSERTVSIKLSAGKGISDFKTTIAQINKAWKQVYPNEKFEYTFFDQTIANFYNKEQKTSQLMNIAMLIAIFISCMGLFGLATFTSQQRVKEIGIRKVLGATALSIVSMLSKEFLGLIIISLLVASPIAFYLMHYWLQGFAYRININLWVFLLSGSAAMVIALLTVSFQTLKAALTNPVNSLRNE